MPLLRAAMGIAVFVFIAWLLSSDRRRFPVRIVLAGLALQWVLAWLVLRTAPGRVIFDGVGRMVTAVLAGADAGAAFVFGPLAGSHPQVAWPAIAGIKILTTIVVFSCLSQVGYHYGIVQRVVAAMAWVMKRSLGVSGAESLAGAANVFVGQTEAPLLVRPYIATMSRSELMALMTGGFATVAAGVMAVYVGILSGGDAQKSVEVARHLLTASLMSAPAAFVMAKVMIPETDPAKDDREFEIAFEKETTGLVDAISTGASQGMILAINVLAMLIAFVALIAVLNIVLGVIGGFSFMQPVVQAMGLERLDASGLLGLVFSPVAWLIGADGADCRVLGGLLGQAMATNEMFAYGSLWELIANGGISKEAALLATYCLCGFANFSSIGIQIGGIGGMAPQRRLDIVRLGPRAMLGGAMACWSTGCIAGALAV